MNDILNVKLLPITQDSKIPFDKVLLLSDGKYVSLGKLEAITKDGFIFDTADMTCLFEKYSGGKRTANRFTHYIIINAEL